MDSDTSICHFSCGSTSAVATLIEICNKPNTEIVYADPNAEHKDNQRFLNDFETLTSRKVTVVKSDKYKSIFDVFKDRKYLAGISGAPCTTYMKKIPIRDYLQDRLYSSPQIFGYTTDERIRVNRFKSNNPLIDLKLPLVRHNVTKKDCQFVIKELGIDLPMMYKLGYKNANCTGCVKASSIGYWAAIREDFPDIFKWYAEFERTIGKKDNTGTPKGAAINRKTIKGKRVRVFLDEIPLDQKPKRNLSFSCGYTCGIDDMEVEIDNEIIGEPTRHARNVLKSLIKLLNI